MELETAAQMFDELKPIIERLQKVNAEYVKMVDRSLAREAAQAQQVAALTEAVAGKEADYQDALAMLDQRDAEIKRLKAALALQNHGLPGEVRE